MGKYKRNHNDMHKQAVKDAYYDGLKQGFTYGVVITLILAVVVWEWMA